MSSLHNWVRTAHKRTKAALRLLGHIERMKVGETFIYAMAGRRLEFKLVNDQYSKKDILRFDGSYPIDMPRKPKGVVKK